MDTIGPVIIIYNPNSTGGSKTMAHRLARSLKKMAPQRTVTLSATRRPGHAETLAYDAAMEYRHCVVVSVSGDGGYHDVMTGLMRAQGHGARPVAALLPAGNANDHFHALHAHGSWNAPDAIIAGKTRRIDLLRMQVVRGGRTTTYYAHSYIGFGFTPYAGRALNQTKLNKFNEIWIVFRSLFRFRSVRLRHNGRLRRYDSITFSNVPRMSKIVRLSDDSRLDDGCYEIATVARRGRWHLLANLVRAATIGLETKQTDENYSFTVRRRQLVQLDGEVIRLGRHVEITIDILPHVLRCIK